MQMTQQYREVLRLVHIQPYARSIHHIRSHTAGASGGEVPYTAVLAKTERRHGGGIKAQYIRALAMTIRTDDKPSCTLASGQHG
jgi:hypothetical protein